MINPEEGLPVCLMSNSIIFTGQLQGAIRNDGAFLWFNLDFAVEIYY